jgi:hypothetical protein
MPVDPLKRLGCPSPMRPFLLLASTFLCLMAGRLCADPLDYLSLVHSVTNAIPLCGASGNGRFVVSLYGVGAKPNALLVSEDGNHWRETRETRLGTARVTSLAYANGMFVGSVGGTAIVSSGDGEKWGIRYLPSAEQVDTIFSALGRFWTVARSATPPRPLISSVDGVVWTNANAVSSARLVFGDESTLIVDGVIGTNSVRMISTNGVDFARIAEPMRSFSSLARVRDTWVGHAASTLSSISVSTNGTNWVTVNLGESITSARLFVRGGRFILTGSQALFFMDSIDGYRWTVRNVAPRDEIAELVFGNDSMLVVARTGVKVYPTAARFHLSRPFTPTLPEPLEASLRPAIVLRSGIVGAGYSIESATKPEGPWIHATTVFPTNFPFSVLVPDGHGERGFFRSVLRDR